ncbi:fanconi-associated nuclease 1 [Astatotilapia calliptera]|uniref:Fanconi-associated nuclease n=1 Tax=Astatotilapia calliptera TaxID=8154 RepID=A0A3P8P8U4_ASTCA|nr:fanconi-associated nuclease 1 [Astatotilapia calliptera]
MAERANKGKLRGRLSLSRTKKTDNVVKVGTAARGATTSPITSFFSSKPPPKLACPLCGQLVPRFKINEHIDLQCQNFERGDSTVGSASNSVISSTQLSPRRSLPESPAEDRKVEEAGEKGKETKTSPYFKKNNFQQAPREINSKTVVRTIDLGSLSSKLSRKFHKAPERKETVDELDETLNSSQKENLLIQSLEDKKEDLPVRSTSVVCVAAVEDPSHSEKQHKFENKASKSDTVQKQVTPKPHSSPSKPANNSQQAPREINSKTVVRTIDRESLSSKLAGNFHKASERKETVDELDETLNSSQKENLLIQSLEDEKEGMTRRSTSVTCAATVQDPSHSKKQHKFENKASKSDTVQKQVAPKPHSSPSKPAKRKSKSSISKAASFKKKAKLEKKSSEGKAGTTDLDQHETVVALSACDQPLNLEETCEEKVAVVSGDLLPVFGADSITSEQSSTTASPHLPYYLRNFKTVLHAVLENEDDRELFNQDDLSFIRAFENLSVMGQKLYVRLFQRKLKWLQVNKLDYEEICSDLGPISQELVQSGFLETENDLEDLGEALDLLPAPELKALAKTFHLGNSATQKQQVVDGLLRLSKQKSLFTLTTAQNSVGAVILKRAKQLAGSCVRLCRGPRAVFSRVLLLFSLTDTVEEEEMAAGGQSQLYTILLVNSGRLAFPDYTVQRVAKVFQDREDLIRYEASMRALQEVILAMQGGQWETAMELYAAAKSQWLVLKKNNDLSHQEKLPVFLRCFTAGWAYTRILSRGVEILQRLRRYEEAVEELRSLLLQSVYCPDSRGRWWDRLALNVHQHLKSPEQAICAIRDGLSDPLVRTGHKLALHHRAVRMKESASCKKYRLQLRDLPTVQVQDVKHVTIRGQLFPHEGGMGKSKFLLPANEEGAHSTVICSVEELSLAHYRQQGFDQGIHGEGSTFSTLFALLLWDIIFMDSIPDVFRNPYQTCPLDFYTDCFYENRKDAIESRVQLLCEASVETLQNMLEDVWNSQEGKVCSLVSWERFSSLQQAQSLVACLGGAFLGGVIARMAKDYRHCRGGLPDLVVWNSSNNSYKLVEVKGPNDRLSHKQQIWLDELQKLGADVEVCHVTATGARGARLE